MPSLHVYAMIPLACVGISVAGLQSVRLPRSIKTAQTEVHATKHMIEVTRIGRLFYIAHIDEYLHPGGVTIAQG
jgi:hypothetical protein